MAICPLPLAQDLTGKLLMEQFTLALASITGRLLTALKIVLAPTSHMVFDQLALPMAIPKSLDTTMVVVKLIFRMAGRETVIPAELLLMELLLEQAMLSVLPLMLTMERLFSTKMVHLKAQHLQV